MTTTAVLQARDDDRSSIPLHPLHPWLRGLEVFGLPFLCYDSRGHRTYVSSTASLLLQRDYVGQALGELADRAANAELSAGVGTLHIVDFPLVRESPTWLVGLVFAVHAFQGPGASRIAVVLRPSAEVCSAGASLPGLTLREVCVARLIAAGLSTKEIASRLGISVHTARHHTERVFTKLGVHTRAGAAAVISARLGTQSVSACGGSSPV